jgi:hypothetical protein
MHVSHTISVHQNVSTREAKKDDNEIFHKQWCEERESTFHYTTNKCMCFPLHNKHVYALCYTTNKWTYFPLHNKQVYVLFITQRTSVCTFPYTTNTCMDFPLHNAQVYVLSLTQWTSVRTFIYTTGKWTCFPLKKLHTTYFSCTINRCKYFLLHNKHWFPYKLFSINSVSI